MQQAPEQLIELARTTIEPMGFEVVGVQLLGAGRHGKKLRIYIDAPQGIMLDDCAAVSRQMSAVMDVEDPISGNYDLEVSSPGLDRPLFNLEHFERFAGQMVTLRTLGSHHGRRKFSGKLLGRDGESIQLDVDGEQLSLPFSDIDSARIVPQF
ncbi:MAG: ribosome maturation factor RimP [Pseudomonadota bacterium]